MQGAFNHVASAARTANRVVAVTQGEVENTEDLEFKRNLVASSEAVKQSEGALSRDCMCIHANVTSRSGLVLVSDPPSRARVWYQGRVWSGKWNTCRS